MNKAPYLMNRWYVAGLSEELSDAPLGRTLLGEPVVLYRATDGAPVALEDRCCHRQAALSLGEIEGDNLRCGYHGLLFDGAGRCVEAPGQKAAPPKAKVRSYPARESQGFVFVWMGAPDMAAAAEPYRHPYLTRDGWTTQNARFHAKCNYRLLIDNLLDVTHLTYAHKSTIGAAGVTEAAAVKYERDGEKIAIDRWMMDIEPAPAHVRATGYNGKMDRWQRIEFTPPGFVWLKVGVAKAGTGARDGDLSGALMNRHTLHVVTPETETASHYFWVNMNETTVPPDQERMIFEQSVTAFNEDLVILEAQQERWTGAVPTIDLAADAGALQARRVLDGLLEAEG
jgi:phenylpropionate dioxygenase-like ring-hydroxylating dioxygenase large terminal subunit